MKSFLSQGKTVALAIEKAIQSANYPEFFTVKIVEQGNKSIFWWLAKDAVVIFSYEDDKSKKFNNNNMHKRNVFLYKNHSFHDEPSVTSIIQQNKKNNNQNNSNQNKEYAQKEKKIDVYKNNNIGQVSKNNKGFQSACVTEKTHREQVKKSQDGATNKRRHPLQDMNENYYDDIKKQDRRGSQKNIDNNEHNAEENKNFPQKDKGNNNKPQSEGAKRNTEIYKEQEVKKEILQKNELQNVLPHNENVWQELHVLFVREWMQNLNTYLSLTSADISYKVDKNKLTILIHILDCAMEKDKKYLYSSIVLLLYKALQKQFPGFFIYDNEYKIVIE